MSHRIVPSLLTIACTAALGILPSASSAQSYSGGSVSGVAEREIVRRQERMTRADEAIAAGDTAMSQDQYDQAVAQYKLAVDFLPDALATSTQRTSALEKFSDASTKLAEQRISEGRFADAQSVIARVLEYDPDDEDAQSMLKHLDEPDYYNKTVGPKFVASVEEVKKFLIDADGFYNSARYDMAFKRYEQVLKIDPYNVAARKGQEKVNKARSEYATAGYGEARARAMWQVDGAWQNPIATYGDGNKGVIIQDSTRETGTAYITAKLSRIIIPRIEFKDATIREAIDYLKSKSRDLDTDPDPNKRGVNIVLKLDTAYRPSAGGVAPSSAPVIPGLETAPIAADTPVASSGNPGETPITLSLANVPMIEALKYITTLANLKFKIEAYAVSVVPLSEPIDVLITKQYQVAPGFIANAPAAAADAAAPAGGDADGAGATLRGRVDAKTFLETSGVLFPPGASAVYQSAGSRLIVKNTQENLDLIDTLVDLGNLEVPKQVEIESKFVEIQQTNVKELSFDWLLGQFDLDSNGRLFGGGGTQGNASGLNSNDFPFVDNTGNIVGTNPITNGNRSGSNAISANAIDALLFGVTGASGTSAPGIFGLSGVFTDPQFQLVIRALDQKKGVDLLSAPRVTTKSGLRAVIEIIREFRYPTEFEPPQIPDEVGSTINGNSSILDPITGLLTGSQSSTAIFPVTPTTPTAFETRNTGVTLEVEPQVGPDGQTIDLTLAPSVTEFEGFINYGSPILSGDSIITANVINQPIFSTRKVQTQVSIWDGQTVVIGGLMREDVQKVEDKTPFLGDIPLIGRLFRSNVDQHIKRNLVIFVTARLLNPAGQPILNNDLEEEIVEPMPLTELTPPSDELPNFAK